MKAGVKHKVSHKYVITEGCKTVLLCLINLYSCSSQAARTERLSAWNLSFKEPSHDICMSYSCSKLHSPL